MTRKNARKTARILNVKIDSTTRSRVLASVASFLAKKHKFLIVTPNPEIILTAQKDQKLATALEKADISLPDGRGVVWAARQLGLAGPKETIPGREMVLDLIALANKKGWRVFLLGDDGADDAAAVLRKSFQKVKIESAAGPRLTKDAKPVIQVDSEIQKDIVKQINDFSPHLLFVAFGAPKQEKWLVTNWENLNVGGAMVVGGALDYINGRAKLPPKWLAQAGLEWLWRLVSQPWRASRIFRAVVVFPLKIVVSKLFSGQ